MGTFNTRKLLQASPSLIPLMVQRITEQFEADGYEVESEQLSSGGCDVSLRKGGFFKSVLGMKTALKVSLQPQGGNIMFEAGVGIFGQQIIPLAITYFIYWPVAITQIWGLVKQSKLDDKALQVVQDVIIEANAENNFENTTTQSANKKFCTQCGAANSSNAKFCSACGAKLE
jgi:ribosomal protein L40E